LGAFSNRNVSLAVRVALACVPALFAVPVIYALVASFLDVVGTAHPFFGDISGTSADAQSISLGGPLYQDPGAGYTPLTYTPLMSVLWAGLDRVVDWDGWGMVLTILADAALVGVAATLAYRPGERTRPARVATLIGALGMGGVAFWLVGFVPFNSLYVPRPDQLSWAFALTGLALVPAAARGSRGAQIAAVGLLALGFWTKQPTIIAPAAACAWLAVAARRGVAPVRRCAALIGAVILLGVVSFALVDVLTGGWTTTFVIDMPADRPRPVSLGSSVHDLITSVAPAAIAAIALWLAAAWSGLLSAPSRSWLRARDAIGPGALSVAAIFLVFVVLDAPAALFFRQAVGSTQNQFVGIAWALGLLAALGWGFAQRVGLHAAVGAASIVAALFLVSEIAAVGRSLHDADVAVPPKELRAVVFKEPPALLSYARSHLVYHPAYPGIGVHRESDLYPGQFNVNGLNRSGRAAGYLERALLDRRFVVVYPFSGNGDAGPWEANYLWKLNQVIDAKYQTSGTLPHGLDDARVAPYPFVPFIAGPPMVRRPGPDPAPWMANCFAPFEIRGATWRIGAGGGFWCRPGGLGTVLELVGTPAPESEIRTDDYEARTDGVIRVTAPRPGTVTVDVGNGSVRRAVGPGKPVSVAVPSGSRGIDVTVSAASHARVDLRGVPD
jgi:hypothetical protein